MKHSSQY